MNERCLIVIPTHNRASNLRRLIEETLLVADLLGEPAVNVLVVDDHSADGTGSVAEDLKQSRRGRVDVLHRLDRGGEGSAYVIGFRYALASGYDYVVQMAANFSHDPSLLPRLLRAAREADLVLGSRYLKDQAPAQTAGLRYALSRAGSYYAGMMLGLGIHDLTSGFKCFRRSALEALDLASIHSEGDVFHIEVTYQCAQLGLRVVEVPIAPRDYASPAPLSVQSLWDSFTAVWQLRLFRAAIALGRGGKSAAAQQQRDGSRCA